MTAAIQTLWAELVATTLADAGAVRCVISPGSRSTPLVAALAREPRLELTTLIDERAAAFFALGAARATGAPVALVCTSGTAAAHYLPAIIEASVAGVPLIVLTADRPPELQGCGASQTIDQVKLYGDFVRAAIDLGPPSPGELALRAVRRKIIQAITTALGPDPGPVHVQLPLRKPLEPAAPATDAERALAAAAARLAGPIRVAPPRLTPDAGALAELAAAIAAEPDGVIVAGALPAGFAASRDALLSLAARAGYPIVAECGSQLRLAPRPGPLSAASGSAVSAASGSALSGLSGSALSGLSGSDHAAGLSGSALSDVSGSALSLSGSDHAAGLSGTALSVVSGSALSLSGSALSGLSGSALSGLSGSALSGLSGSALSDVSGSALSLSGSALSGLSGSALSGLSGSALSGLSGSNHAAGLSGSALSGQSGSDHAAGPSGSSASGATGPAFVDHFDLVPPAALPVPRLVIQLGDEPVAAAWPAWLAQLMACGSARWVLAGPRWHDPESSARGVILGDVAAAVDGLATALAAAMPAPRSGEAAATWREIEGCAARATASAIDAHPRSETAMLRAALDAVPAGAAIQLGNSLPIRVADQQPGGGPARVVLTQRGAAGIDGLIASAAGATWAGRPVLLVLGDVSFAHDLGGLLAARVARAPLAILVVDNRGGQIFAGLPIARAHQGAAFDRHWLTAPELDPAAVAAAVGAAATTAVSPAAAATAIARALAAPGVTVIHAPVTASGAHDVRRAAIAEFPAHRDTDLARDRDLDLASPSTRRKP